MGGGDCARNGMRIGVHQRLVGGGRRRGSKGGKHGDGNEPRILGYANERRYPGSRRGDTRRRWSFAFSCRLMHPAGSNSPWALNVVRASQFAQLALKGIDREYPNKSAAVLTGPQDVMTPAQMHPAFFGCFDWHSAVHGHWLLVRLLRTYPTLPEAKSLRERLSAHLTAENLAREAAYFATKA